MSDHEYVSGTHCNSCRAAYMREWYKTDVGQIATWRSHLKRKYNMTMEDYDRMLEAQDGVCASCGEVETYVAHGKVKRLAVDHDHETGLVRGLLCHACNAALGHLKDDPRRIMNLAEYISAYL